MHFIRVEVLLVYRSGRKQSGSFPRRAPGGDGVAHPKSWEGGVPRLLYPFFQDLPGSRAPHSFQVRRVQLPVAVEQTAQGVPALSSAVMLKGIKESALKGADATALARGSFHAECNRSGSSA